jgi:hypothetical protein
VHRRARTIPARKTARLFAKTQVRAPCPPLSNRRLGLATRAHSEAPPPHYINASSSQRPDEIIVVVAVVAETEAGGMSSGERLPPPPGFGAVAAGRRPLRSDFGGLLSPRPPL